MSKVTQEACRVVEPSRVEDYADVVTKAAEGDVVVLQRNGADVAVIVPIAYLELLQESVA